jgi:hypothetical protein
LDAFVVDVNDLAVAERFWVAVSGLPLKYSGWTGSISRLGDPPVSIMLQLVPERKTPLKNRAHLDFLVEDVAVATAQVVELGGRVIKEPGLFFEPGSPDPVLEWAVVADPFGNEFCVIRELPEPGTPT